MKKGMAAAVVLSACLLAGCASRRYVALPQDVTYIIMSINGADTRSDARPDIVFSKDGRFSGTTGCNRYFGQYIFEREALEISENIGMTQMYCHNMAEQEQAFIRALSKVNKFERKGDRLILTTSDGVRIEGVRAPEGKK